MYQTALLLYKINKNWVSISDTRCLLNKINMNEKKPLELLYDYDSLEYDQEVIEKMINILEYYIDEFEYIYQF